MKKSIFFSLIVTIMFGLCSLTSCKCDKAETPERQAINPTNSFDELVWKINEQVMADYPTVGFYEAFSYLAEYDSTNYGVIDPFKTMVVYGDTEGMRTVMASVDSNWMVQYEVVEEPWLEDMFTTPYVPMQLELALELIQKEVDVIYEPGTIVVLRHQLYYMEPEPRYFIGPIAFLHTVNVYTGEVDAQLAGVTDALDGSYVYNINCEEDSVEDNSEESAEEIVDQTDETTVE